MFAFRSRSGYQNIDDETVPSQAFGADSTVNDRTPLVSEGRTVEDDGPSEVYGSPPLEHDVAVTEAGRNAESHATANFGAFWDGVEDLDQFFTRVYEYHQNGGFVCIVIKHILTLLQFIFVVWFVAFLRTRVDYGVLFKNKNVTADGRPISDKIRLDDVIYPDWISHMDVFTICLLLFAALFWCFRAARVMCQISHFREIRTFYHKALGIKDSSLGNLKWREIVQSICEKQPSIHLILNKDGITPLDLYQRILRHKNYFVALVNQKLLPPVINVPFFGSVPYLPNGLKMNLEWLLFYGMWSPWKGPYEVKDEYKHRQNIFRLGDELGVAILKMAIGNLICFPLVFIYQVLYFFFTYGELLKRDPSSFAIRRYSNYGRNKLRHFNELDHELRMRLSRSHRAATQYMEQFVSPLGQVIARKVQFVAGAICIVLLLLSVWDEDVLTVEHILTIISVSGLIAVGCQAFIADENMIYWPETLLNVVISHIHYAPDSWKGRAHTDFVRKEFGYLFQLKAQFLLEELLSPILTPFILLFWIRPRAKEFVDFFHNFTESVEGLGDICSFAKMDIGRHGDPSWSFDGGAEGVANVPQKVSANDGKTELSLIHFASNHPEWKPPLRSARFLNDLRERMDRDMMALKEGDEDENILLDSIQSFQPISHQKQYLQMRKAKGGFSVPASMYVPDLCNTPTQMSVHVEGKNFIDMDAETQSMSLSVAYLRCLHARNENQRRGRQQAALETPLTSPPARSSETVADIWGVPAQSTIAPLPTALSLRIEDEQRQNNNVDTADSSLSGLSAGLLDV